MPKHCLIIGSGAIGSFYGYKLAQSRTVISIVSRSDYDHIKKHGIKITLPNQKNEIFKPNFILKHNDYSQLKTYDYVIVCTKVLPSIDFSFLIKPYLSTHTVIVLIQNGINIEAVYRQAFPNHKLISGLAFICVTRTAPGMIHHQDYGKLTLGNFPTGTGQSCKELVNLFSEAKTDCHLSTDIAKERFIKLLWNASFNPLSVIEGGVTTQELLSNPDNIKRIRNIMEDVLKVAILEGHDIKATLIDTMIENTKKMTPYKTSMLIDYERGLPLEIDAILGNLLNLAKKHNIVLSAIQKLYRDLMKLS